MTQTYHHGNLRHDLIEAGIELINQDGLEHLSLRKLASKCAVSHAAPYNHFKDKDDFIEAIKEHITQDFSSYLSEVIQQRKEDENLLIELGVNYIQYFIQHKQYYRFLFSYFNFHVVISENDITCEDFSVFSLYRDTAIAFMRRNQIDEKEYTLNILATWAIVEGLTSILVSDHTICEVNQEALIRELLSKKMRLI